MDARSAASRPSAAYASNGGVAAGASSEGDIADEATSAARARARARGYGSYGITSILARRDDVSLLVLFLANELANIFPSA
jgi:hypothetical protein